MTLIDPLTPQLPIGPYMPPFEPLNNVTPFTYRDGTTYLRQLELLGVYVNETLVNFINQNFTELGAAFVAQVRALIESVNDHIDAQTAAVNAQLAEQDVAATAQLAAQNTAITDQLAAQDSETAATVATMVQTVNDAVASIINSTIAVSDPVIDGVLANLASATRARILGFIQTNAAVKSYLPFNPMDYNAKGDNATIDTVALQAAISAAATFGGTNGPIPIELPAHTFIVDLPAGKDYMLQVYPGTVIRGASRGSSVVKVKNATGDYRSVFAGATTGTDLSGTALENFTIDHNNTNNPVSDATNAGPLFHGFPRYAFYAPVADNATVRNMIFKDIDAINTVVTTGKNNRVIDSLFVCSPTSPNYHDYSALYMSGDDVLIADNTFIGTPASNNARTAIETHAGLQSVHDNRIRGFVKGINVTGIRNTGPLSDQIDVHDNIITGANYGIAVYSQTGGIRNVNIHDNTVVIDHDQWIKTTADYPQAIYVDPLATTDIYNLDIHHNTMHYLPSTQPAQTGELSAAGIALRTNNAGIAIHNLSIMHNRIIGSLSAGIRITSKIDQGRVKFNEIVDPGSSTEAAMASLYKTGVVLVGGIHNDLDISDNVIRDTRVGAVIQSGITLSGTSGCVRLTVKRNRTTAASGVTLPPVMGSGVLSAYIKEEMDVYSAQNLNCLVGSELVDLSTGNRYVQTTAPNGTTWAVRAL